ncbi:hypothetical protein NSQ51_13575 [Geobacillus sp. FSL K6-0789]|uniref:Uncharacterized protein n=1 Tax=Geobacillus stearothermophilus TaxID=1422 RepID=A0A3L7D1T2_GEOSE|nr:hypothetical protein [Geobacillus stearothermophilus]RLQ08671.1 hypothetical protein D9549_07225 [Geobacillus stearothermophilus]RLQ10740.1 hypothetical protein D9547_07255 [Geobacillus stearothermophilus]RLQ14016.1 hypothetical protein D9548_07840 [Geobacillus stearothermophilus]
MQIKRVSFDELPEETKKLAGDIIDKERIISIFSIEAIDYGNGNISYNINGISKNFIVEIGIHSRRGVEWVNSVGLSTIRDAIKACPELLERFGLE